MTSDDSKKRWGDLPNNITAAFVGRPSRSKFEKMMRSDGLGERESSRVARRLNEPFHPLGVKIVQVRATASRGVEWPPSNPLGYIQIPDQGCVECCDEIVRGIEPLSDQSGLRPVDQRLHLGMPAACSGSLHENQTMRPGNRRLVELALRRGNPFLVLASVFLAEQPDVDIAALGFFQIQVIRAAVRCRNVLEQE